MDCSFENENVWFRYRACAIIIKNDCVLMAKNDRDSYYYSVGGAVKIGETTEQAVIREVYEETGEIYEIDRLAFVHENLFTDTVGRQGHEIALYYLMKPKGVMTFEHCCVNMYGVKKEVNWLEIEKFSMYKAYPTFFATELKDLMDEIKHITTIESTGDSN